VLFRGNSAAVARGGGFATARAAERPQRGRPPPLAVARQWRDS